MAGKAGRGSARSGAVRHRRHGAAWLGLAGQGIAGMAWRGAAWRDKAGHGNASQARHKPHRRAGYKSPETKHEPTTKNNMTETTIKPTAAEEIRRIAEKHGGRLTPKLVVTAAKRKSSPLHSLFDWDDTEAAKKWRLEQASCLIRRIKVTYHKSDDVSVRVRAFVNVDDDAKDRDQDTKKPAAGIYVPFETALAVESYREQLMQQCRRDVETFRRKYAALSEVAAIIDAMNEFAN
jgi:hypothetical protein